MKKVFKSKIFIIVILCIISCGIGVYAGTTYPYKASDVVYNSSDGTSMNVNEALNELYNNKNSDDPTITLYILSAKSSTSGLGEGTYVTFKKSQLVSSVAWGNYIGNIKCKQNSDYFARVWLTGWE